MRNKTEMVLDFIDVVYYRNDVVLSFESMSAYPYKHLLTTITL